MTEIDISNNDIEHGIIRKKINVNNEQIEEIVKEITLEPESEALTFTQRLLRCIGRLFWTYCVDGLFIVEIICLALAIIGIIIALSIRGT